MAATLRGLLAPARVQQRRLDPHHRAAASRAVTELLRRIQQRNPDDLFVGEYEGLYCFGCEEFKQPAQIVNGHCIEHPTLELVPTKERNHFFRLSRYRDRLLELIRSRRAPGRAGDPAERDRPAARGRAAGHLGVPAPAVVGHSLPRRSGADGLRLVRRADQLSLGDRVSRRRGTSGSGPPTCTWSARGSPGSTASSGRRCCSRAGVALPREVWAHGYVQWEGTKMSKIGRHGGDPGRGDRAARPGRAALLPAPRGRLRGGRQFHLGAVRRALHRGPGRRAGQSRLALAGDAGEVPGRRGAAAPRSQTTLDQAGPRVRSGDYAAAMDASGPARRRGGGVGARGRRRICYIQQVAPWSLAKAGREAELDVALACAGSRALPAGGAGRPVHPRQGAKCSGSRSGSRGRGCATAWSWRCEEPAGGGASYRQARRCLFPKPQSCLEVRLSNVQNYLTVKDLSARLEPLTSGRRWATLLCVAAVCSGHLRWIRAGFRLVGRSGRAHGRTSRVR